MSAKRQCETNSDKSEIAKFSDNDVDPLVDRVESTLSSQFKPLRCEDEVEEKLNSRRPQELRM